MCKSFDSKINAYKCLSIPSVTFFGMFNYCILLQNVNNNTAVLCKNHEDWIENLLHRRSQEGKIVTNNDGPIIWTSQSSTALST